MPESVEEKLTRNLMISVVAGVLISIVLFLVRSLIRGNLSTTVNWRHIAVLLFSSGGCYFLLTVFEEYRSRKRSRDIAQRAKQHAQRQSSIDWSASLQSPRTPAPPTKPDQPS